MKQTMIGVMVVATVLATPVATAQRVQPLPDVVETVSIEGNQVLKVVMGDENRIETQTGQGSVGRIRGNRMNVNAEDTVILRLIAGRSIGLHAEDYASIFIDGRGASFGHLGISTEDYAKTYIDGTATDTLVCTSLTLRSDDFSNITSEVVVSNVEYDLEANDFSRISLAGLNSLPTPQGQEVTTRAAISDFAKMYVSRQLVVGESMAKAGGDGRDYTDVVNNMTDRIADVVREAVRDERGKKSGWSSGGFDLDFSWGWHNWGDAMFKGFGGVDGDAEVGTTFNNIQLTGNWGIATSRWIGFYAGLGLEWDKWKFTTPQVRLATDSEPYAFASTGATTGSTMLTTRYVVVPLSMRVGDKDKVHLVISAIPGVHWNASGLRTKQKVGNSTETTKDRSVNKYVNPYKLDLRAEVRYGKLGIYAQFSTLSVFKGNCEDLLPVKFGLVI